MTMIIQLSILFASLLMSTALVLTESCEAQVAAEANLMQVVAVKEEMMNFNGLQVEEVEGVAKNAAKWMTSSLKPWKAQREAEATTKKHAEEANIAAAPATPSCTETAPCGGYYLGPDGGTAADCALPVADETECKAAYDPMLHMGLDTFGGTLTMAHPAFPSGCVMIKPPTPPFSIIFNTDTGSQGHPIATPICKSATSGSPAAAASQVTGGTIAAVGDPHMQNILGQRFDLAQAGKHTLLQIPRSVSDSDALLRVTADAVHDGGACSDMYFKSLNITGLWVSAQQKDGYMYNAGAPQPVAGWRTFGKVEVKVAWGRTLGGVEYLNFMVRHLTRVGHDVGGLLGMDDYTQAAKRDPSCGSAVLVQLHSTSREASFAMADM